MDVKCLDCTHPINAHGHGSPGVDTYCCTGGERGDPCACQARPNDIAAAHIAKKAARRATATHSVGGRTYRAEIVAVEWTCTHMHRTMRTAMACAARNLQHRPGVDVVDGEPSRNHTAPQH